MSPGGMSRRSKKRWSSERGGPMSAGQKSWIVRILAGGLAGAGLAGAGYRPLFIGRFSAPPLCRALIQSCGILGAVAVTLALFFAFGAAVGWPPCPLRARGGRAPPLRTPLLVTAGLLGAILRVCLGVAWRYLPGWLALLGPSTWWSGWAGGWGGTPRCGSSAPPWGWRPAHPPCGGGRACPICLSCCWSTPSCLRCWPCWTPPTCQCCGHC